MNALDRARFLRGLTIGALIGAVIAGSRIWRGVRDRDRGGDHAGTLADPRLRRPPTSS